MKDSDFIFEEDVNGEDQLEEGNLQPGDNVLVNSTKFEIIKHIKSKEIGDGLGFPAIYSWYKAKGPDGEVNLFFYDDDIDSQEKNDSVAKKWFDTAYEN